MTAADVKSFAKAENFLWTVRCHLHYLAARPEERLTFNVQEELGSRMGYKDRAGTRGVERFMKHYFLTAKDVGDLTRVLCAVLEEQHKKRRAPSWLSGIWFGKREIEGFRIESGRITIDGPQDMKKNPVRMLQLFHAAQHHDLDIHPRAMRLVSQNLKLVDNDLRENTEANRLFMEILSGPDPRTALMWLNETGVFGRFIPDFGRVVAQMQYDMYHVYTVDEHTIRAIDILDGICTGRLKVDHPVSCDVVKEVQSRRALFVAVLLHDIAKGRGGDHSELGAIDAEAFCRRHHLSERDTQLVSWLVENHLLMSMTAQRKDISDPDIIHAFARAIPSQAHLDYLYILTVCDISATNPKLWNTWRASLLRQLYIETKRALRRGTETPIDRLEWVRATQSEAREILHAQNMTDEQIDQIWNTVDDEYFLQDSTVDIAWQTAAIIRHGDNPDPLVLIRDTRGGPTDGYSQIIIYMKDRVALFAATTAVLEQLNLNIVDARISSGDGPYSISSYVVLDEKGQPLGVDPARKERVRQRLIEELDDPEDYPSIIHRRTPRQLKHFAFPTEVTFSNDTGNQRTVMEVITPDRPGLLARIGQVLLEHRVRLTNAKIATLGERVEDVFFITDEHGEPLSDAAKCLALQQDLCKMLDETQ